MNWHSWVPQQINQERQGGGKQQHKTENKLNHMSLKTWIRKKMRAWGRGTKMLAPRREIKVNLLREARGRACPFQYPRQMKTREKKHKQNHCRLWHLLCQRSQSKFYNQEIYQNLPGSVPGFAMSPLTSEIRFFWNHFGLRAQKQSTNNYKTVGWGQMSNEVNIERGNTFLRGNQWNVSFSKPKF